MSSENNRAYRTFTQVKTFSGMETRDVDDRINEWIRFNPTHKISDIKMQFALNHEDGKYYCEKMVMYEKSVEVW